MTWLKKSSAVSEWVNRLQKKEEEICVSIKTKKDELSELNRLLEKVRKQMGEVSGRSQRGAYNFFRVQAKCTACDKALVKVQRNCAWKKCQGCSMWVCGVCIRQRKHTGFKPAIDDELPKQEEPESAKGQPGDFQYHALLNNAKASARGQPGDFQYDVLLNNTEEEEEEIYIIE